VDWIAGGVGCTARGVRRIGRLSFVLLALLALVLSGCARPPALEAPDGVQLTPLRTISTLEARVLLTLAGVKGVRVAHAVDCYRMVYWAPDANGAPVRLGVAARRIVSFQHGTSTTRSAVPSSLDGTGLATAIAFAGKGYALLAPDYPGLGVSDRVHPYYVKAEIAPSVVGMIDAAQRLDAVPKAPVFLAGFSEGGWASFAALEALEARGARVLGSAQVAGPYDLRNISFPAAVRGGAQSHSLYLGYMMRAYAAHYGQPLESVLTPEMAATVARVFSDGSSPEEIVTALPDDPRALFNADFLAAFDDGREHWLLDALSENGLTDAAPHAPVRLYYGAQDKDVSPEEAIAGGARLRARGVDAAAIEVGPLGHDASMLAAAPLISVWLAELEARE
jgi:pimeloyl-ACP methyl ester carboxylesterase